ncbi:MAG: HlyD family efflux transporter periplasmic adaptor subunit [Thermodesulfobacteriota bacterium]
MSITETSEVITDPSDSRPELWADFVSSRNEEDYYQSWLALQSEQIGGVVQGLLIVNDDTQQFKPVASWPESGTEPERLSDVIEQVLEERCGLLLELDTADRFGIAYPVIIDDALFGVAALEAAVIDEAELQQAMENLQWGASWLELLVRRKQLDADKALLQRLKAAVDLLAVTLGKESFSSAAIVFTTEMAQTLDCERVSIGFKHGRHLKLQAVSHSAEVGKKMNLTRAIERVMEESIVQRAEIVYPPLSDEVLISREHESLSRLQSMACISTVPLSKDERYFGALTCERSADKPFTTRDVEFIRGVASLVGPAMDNQYAVDRPLPYKILNSGKTLLQRLFGASHPGLKVVTLLLAGVVWYLSTATGDYRLTADTTLEGAIRRAVVVPFDGYIDQAAARAGDVVEKGALLCALDDRDLRLEKLSRSSKYRQMEHQHQEAVAKHNRAQAAIIKAQLKQLRAEIELTESRLQRTRLTAPFDGLLVSGDLSQRLGSTVAKGEVLFEVTPLDAYRVILKVDERRIADVQPGQQGTLVLSSLPDQRYLFVVDQVSPLTKTEEGRNYFRVEAHLKNVDDSLRPGMEGIGKILIDQRKLVSIWFRDLVEWVKMFLWGWLP